jgi:TRAP-type C4-dicarboxylate transport system substrate-binding protein
MPHLVGLAPLLLVALALPARPARAEPVEIKLATLAPKGSAWAKVMERGARDMESRVQGRVKLKFFFGGQQGDERDMVRQMKLAQLDGAAVTATGLGLIRGDVRVIELPFLFKNDGELDYVRGQMQPDFERQLGEAGYVLLAWGDVGWIHLYSNTPVNGRADLARAKMWAWTDDPIVRALFKRLGVNGVPLGVPDVLPSLQSGTINACYGPPLAAVALQWHTRIRYATSVPIAYATGAILVRKEAWARIAPDDQTAQREAARIMGQDLQRVIRKENERARKVMEKAGIKFVPASAAMVADFEKEGQAVWRDMVGKLYKQELLDKLKQHLAEVRR